MKKRLFSLLACITMLFGATLTAHANTEVIATEPVFEEPVSSEYPCSVQYDSTGLDYLYDTDDGYPTFISPGTSVVYIYIPEDNTYYNCGSFFGDHEGSRYHDGISFELVVLVEEYMVEHFNHYGYVDIYRDVKGIIAVDESGEKYRIILEG